MLNIVKVEKIEIELKKMFELNKGEEIYSLELDEKNIGYGIIRNNDNEKIEIYILNQYQRNGYGTYLFNELLKIINKDIYIRVKNGKIISSVLFLPNASTNLLFN